MDQKSDLVGAEKMVDSENTLRQLISELKKIDDSIRRSIESVVSLESKIAQLLAGLPGGSQSAGARAIPEMPRPKQVPTAPRDPPKVVGEKVSIGVEKVNELLVGGIRLGTNALLTGPPFSGKYVLAWNFVASSLEEGIPVVVISTDRDIGELKYEISRIYRQVDEAEESGLLRFVDIYSRSVQAQPSSRYASIIDSTSNISSLIRVSEQIGTEIRKNYPFYRLIFSSLNSYIAELDDKILVKFVQQFTQKRKVENAVSIYLIDEGQSERRVSDSISYLFDGIVEFKTDASRNFLRVSGLGNVRSRDWIELYLNEISFDLGSFTLEKIR